MKENHCNVSTKDSKQKNKKKQIAISPSPSILWNSNAQKWSMVPTFIYWIFLLTVRKGIF